MHQKLTKHGRFFKQNNQLPTKSHVELKDNPIVISISRAGKNHSSITLDLQLREIAFGSRKWVCLPYNVVKHAMKCTGLRCGRINNNVVKSNLLREASATGPG
jgi:hypothetical protein